MELEQLKEFVKTSIKEHPELKTDILGFYYLCLDEIDEGESETNEISLCISSIEQLIEESNGKK